MLAIRMQRTGRKGHAMFRIVVQESRYTPTSGKVVAQLGHYDPHTKNVSLDQEKATFYLSNGAQPSDRAARLLQKEGIALPNWVALSTERSRTIRNAEKLRSNQPKAEVSEEAAEATPSTEEVESSEVVESTDDTPTNEAPATDDAAADTDVAEEAEESKEA